ncbi:MAG TPA: hypothetical protein VHZ78_00820 [Rhizomicrobium sp.]|jgi:hypothetical protein|nr:hypothetical protein [Rhizomicrobium sp.]
MSLTDLASIGSIVSGLAVLVSLAYVAYQTHLNVKQSRALIQQGRAQRTIELLTRWGEFDWSDGMLACADGSPDVSAADVRRYISLMRALLVNYEDSYLQHQQGLMDDEVYANVDAAFRAAMTSPGHRVAWTTVRHFFGSGFRGYVDRVVAQTAPAAGVNGLLANWQAAAKDLAIR